MPGLREPPPKEKRPGGDPGAQILRLEQEQHNTETAPLAQGRAAG